MDEAKLIELIDDIQQRMTATELRMLKKRLRAAAGLPPENPKPPCECGQPALAKGLCRRHYMAQRSAHLPRCACGAVAKCLDMCKTCYMRAIWVKPRQVECIATRHSWTIMGTCKICKAERVGWQKREVVNAKT